MVMRIFDLEQLAYLHDAVVSEMAFMSTGDFKEFRIKARCDDDCGYEDWSGKTVTITLSYVLRASGVIWGHVVGQDIVNSFSQGVSKDMEWNIRRLRDIGITAPKIFLRLTLHSGSEFEIACDEVDVSMDN